MLYHHVGVYARSHESAVHCAHRGPHDQVGDHPEFAQGFVKAHFDGALAAAAAEDERRASGGRARTLRPRGRLRHGRRVHRTCPQSAGGLEDETQRLPALGRGAIVRRAQKFRTCVSALAVAWQHLDPSARMQGREKRYIPMGRRSGRSPSSRLRRASSHRSTTISAMEQGAAARPGSRRGSRRPPAGNSPAPRSRLLG